MDKSTHIEAAVAKIMEESIMLEARIAQSGAYVRSLSKIAYGTERLDSRLLFIGVLGRLLLIRNGIPGTTSPLIEERMALIVSFVQSISIIETMISEGLYIKVGAAIKQDYEIVARLDELSQNPTERKIGSVPSPKYLPIEMRPSYGELNNVAHVTRPDLLRDILNSIEDGPARGFSYPPIFTEPSAVALYDLHLWLISKIIDHQFMLLGEMYGQSIFDELEIEISVYDATLKQLEEKAGWKELAQTPRP